MKGLINKIKEEYNELKFNLGFLSTKQKIFLVALILGVYTAILHITCYVRRMRRWKNTYKSVFNFNPDDLLDKEDVI